MEGLIRILRGIIFPQNFGIVFKRIVTFFTKTFEVFTWQFRFGFGQVEVNGPLMTRFRVNFIVWYL